MEEKQNQERILAFASFCIEEYKTLRKMVQWLMHSVFYHFRLSPGLIYPGSEKTVCQNTYKSGVLCQNIYFCAKTLTNRGFLKKTLTFDWNG